MAANRFATMLHRNTNKITLILIYAVLEWILIVLLLLNSLFSYLIIKFAEFFGLKPPCLWCTRIDHLFDPAKGNMNMHRDLLCEVHSKEVSRLGYCSNHQKLVDSQELCEDCLSSRPEFEGSSHNFALSPWMKGFEKIQNCEGKVGENGEVSLNCSCCGVSIDNNRYASYILLETSSWDALECSQKENLITEAGFYDDNLVKKWSDPYDKISVFSAGDDEKLLEDKNENAIDGHLEVTEKETNDDDCISVSEENEENSTLIMKDKSVQVCVEQDLILEIPPQQHLEFFLDYSGNNLVPIELVDKIEDGDKNKDQDFEEKEELVMESESRGQQMDSFLDIDINEEPKYTLLDSMEIEEDENSLVFHAKDRCSNADQFESFRDFWPTLEASDVQEPSGEAREKHLDVYTDNVACEEVTQGNNENEADVSIGTEIPDLDITDEIQIQDSVHSDDIHEGPSTSSNTHHEEKDHGRTRVEEQMEEGNNETLLNMELSEVEEDKVPDTPTSMDSLNQLHKKLLLLEKRDSGMEESLDGSVTSELEGSDGVVTIEHLKSALRAERKALQALYAELEEERSASAVAANQTMAMINRLQEEKAAMQMEALQYQRMMEEQSEYDQEALQLLNELMVKREREKAELEKELEGYRKKVLDSEKEKLRVLKKSNGFSSASCSNGEDSDGLSVDLNQEANEDEGFYHNTPVDAVINLEESLADFEEERFSILEQLKVLEEKLVTLDDENLHEENGVENGYSDGHTNGFSKHDHHQKRRIAGQKGKSLLPLFDAINDDENGDVMLNGNGMHDFYESKIIVEDKKVAIEGEVDHLYERLQGLEADREFLKHCISSLKKGDKGMELLQEILQHLRDLRNVELRVRNLSDNTII